ncbi:hypothetical protein K505DRAFT_416360 [Melanomma pulvis-pyrius CBS 109.77]|uniref:NACHT domain-containing protein n=1 Tax=Melanomma pulvis-pyrius CBS 109.77 TaxID=1314802 RepID=A0A6A6XI29_9PLEO|nr:hypothetical protein K505DRAFT_416360 [Melanomma pulvis-pyrius CBS 109.77]
MADPITIISLASSIITFIDFGLKVISGTKNVRDSLHGTTAEVHELDIVMEDIQRSNNLAKKQQSSGQKLSSDEVRILEMVGECELLVAELRTAINQLRIRTGARSKTLESARVFTRSLLKQGDLQNLRSRLDKLDERIRRNLEYAMQKEQNSSIMIKLAEIEVAHKRMHIQDGSRLDLIREDILRSTKQSQSNIEMRAATQAAQLASLKTKLDILQREHSTCTRQIKVLESLYFPELRRRWYQIRKADQRSNEWAYDPQQTSLVPWLESQKKGDGLFYITGRAGSGKSTLMKFVYENQCTTQSLEKWAGTAKLYTASYYFWNQGTEMQKSGVGLFQSLLYQILKSTPDLITSVCQGRLNHEIWEMEDLNDIFKRIAEQTELDAKFCFFIDGLDEYDGEERDVIQLLQALSISRHIKICVSSRPGRQYESFLRNDDRTFDIAHFTKGDMRRYIDTHLQASRNWRSLVESDPACQDIIKEISARAGGVWLWVSLVTDDIVKEADKNERVSTLRKIVDEFPDDLHDYFERIIKRIPKLHREEMAQTFLIAVEELQPLPLYAFALLEEERKNNNYAIEALVKPISEAEVELKYPALKDRVRNRCSDLLIVDHEPHPVFLSHSVDFLHRTVRDFLRDYDKQLKIYLVKEFDPLVSLSRVCLSLLKALPVANFRDRDSANRVIAFTDELLYYAREVEKRSSLEQETPLVRILDELDTVNSYHARKISNHWTHARDSPAPRGLDEYYEKGQCNFLALTVQARLVKYVRAKVRENPHIMQKRGRPLLDYALRPRRITPISMPYHSLRDDPSLDVDMVKLLLHNGADPNQPVHLNGARSVWALFLLSMHETHLSGGTGSTYQSLNKAWYQACKELVQAGARSDCLSNSGRDDLSISSILNRVFGWERAVELQQMIEQEKNKINPSNSLCITM